MQIAVFSGQAVPYSAAILQAAKKSVKKWGIAIWRHPIFLLLPLADLIELRHSLVHF